MNTFEIQFFEDAERFIKSLPDVAKGKMTANINLMSKDLGAVNTKLLKSPIKELKVKKYRLLFFIERNTIYMVSGFVKKSQRTPLREIQHAEAIYKQFKAQ